MADYNIQQAYAIIYIYKIAVARSSRTTLAFLLLFMLNMITLTSLKIFDCLEELYCVYIYIYMHVFI